VSTPKIDAAVIVRTEEDAFHVAVITAPADNPDAANAREIPGVGDPGLPGLILSTMSVVHVSTELPVFVIVTDEIVLPNPPENTRTNAPAATAAVVVNVIDVAADESACDPPRSA
jgi:hypothetical protein